MPVLLDTGPIVALLDETDHLHQMASKALRDTLAPLITCEAVITECCHLLRKIDGAAEAVIQNIEAGIFQIPFQMSRDTSALHQILRRYRDRQIDLADACLIRLADQLGTGEILTFDSDFRIYRWGRNRAFQLLIDIY
jgi:uncharacterized protein